MGRPRKKLEAPPIEEHFEDGQPDFEELEPEQGDIDLAPGNFSPLFPHSGQPESKVPACIMVHSIHPVRGTEFRGKVQPDATEEVIFAQFGNGTYNLKLVDEHGRYLRSRSNVKINMNEDALKDSTSVSPRSDFDMASLKDLLREERERSIAVLRADRERDEKRAAEDRHRADSFLAMIQTTRAQEAEQTRQFFSAQAQQSMQNFNQTLQILTTANSLQMQMMQAQLKLATERPNTELQTFLAGLQFANGINPLEDDKPDPMTAVLAGGLQMFGQIAGASNANAGAKKSLPPSPKKKALPAPAPAMPNPLDAPPVMTPALPEATAPKKKGALTDDEIEEIKALKILSAQKGLSMAAILKLGRENIDQLAAFVGPNAAEEEDEEEDLDDEEGTVENEELDGEEDSEHSSDGDDESDEDGGDEEGSDSVDGEGPSDEEGTD